MERNNYSLKFTILLIGVFSLVSICSAQASEEICKSPKLKSMLFSLNELDENIFKIQSSDLVLSEDRKLKMISALNQLSVKPTNPEELEKSLTKESQIISSLALADVKIKYEILNKQVMTGSTLNEKVLNDFIKAIQSGMAKVVTAEKNKLGESSLASLQKQVVQLMASTDFFFNAKSLIQQLMAYFSKNCIGQKFSFTTHLPDGKAYFFSDCDKLIKNDATSEKWGGPLVANHCRDIVYCHTKEYTSVKADTFPGFGYEWIIDCKKEDGQCPAIEKCVQHIDLGSGQVTAPKDSSNPGVR